MKLIPLTQYLKEIRNRKAALKKEVLNVFVMTDNQDLLNKLKGELDPSIHIFSLVSASPCMNGHDQGTFNLSSKEVKEEAYIQFLTELTIMQKIPALVCSLSSNVGRFLYTTCDSINNFKSLDTPRYTPI